MTFDNLAQQVQVIGPGHMLIEDYRSASPGNGRAIAAATSAANPASQPTTDATDPTIHFSGRGKTLFTWTGQLTLDAYHNDMLIEQEVQMVHATPENTDPVQLDCRALSGGHGFVWRHGGMAIGQSPAREHQVCLG